MSVFSDFVMLEWSICCWIWAICFGS